MEFTKDFLGFWKGLTKFINEQGYWRMTKVVLFVAFTICLFYIAKNFGESFDVNRAFQKEVVKEAIVETNEQNKLFHAQQMKLREKVKPEISKILRQDIVDLDADRSFVIELHNGSNNTAGFPFLHCTMTYEEVKPGIEPADEDYQNITLSRFNFPQYLHENDIWIGKISDGVDIDPKICKKLTSSDVTYIVIATIKSTKYELGYYGIVYCNGHKPAERNKILQHFLTNVQHLSKLLDRTNENNDETNE